MYTLNKPYKYVDRDGNKAGVGVTSIKDKVIESSKTTALGWLPVNWIAKSVTEATFKSKYLVPNFHIKYHTDGITQYRNRKKTVKSTDLNKIQLRASSTNSSGGNQGSGSGKGNNGNAPSINSNDPNFIGPKPYIPKGVCVIDAECPSDVNKGMNISNLNSVSLKSGNQLRLEMSMNSLNNDPRLGYASSYKIGQAKIFEFNAASKYKEEDIEDFYGLNGWTTSGAFAKIGKLINYVQMIVKTGVQTAVSNAWSMITAGSAAPLIPVFLITYSLASLAEFRDKLTKMSEQIEVLATSKEEGKHVLKYKYTEIRTKSTSGNESFSTNQKNMQFYTQGTNLDITKFKSNFVTGTFVALYKF